MAVTEAQFRALQAEVAALRAEVAKLRPAPAPAPTPAPTPAPSPDGVTLGAPKATVVGSAVGLAATLTTTAAKTFRHAQIAVRGPGGSKPGDVAFNNGVTVTGPLKLSGSFSAPAAGDYKAFVAYSTDGATWVDGPATTFTVAAAPADSPEPAPAPAPAGTGKWLSGAASQFGANGSYGNWRGRPVEIGGTWVNSPALEPLQPGKEWGGYKGPIDLAVAPPSWGGWGAEAGGAHDGFFRDLFRSAKNLWSSKGTVYMRPWYEFNGDWMEYSVRPGNEADFKAAWTRMANIARTEFPAMKLVWCGSASNKGMSMSAAWPGDDKVDVVGVDFYNNWPFTTTQAQFDAKIKEGQDQGLLGFQAWARAHGKPLAISEWSNQGAHRDAGQGGGGESPQFIRSFHAWLAANAGAGPGQVLYEVHFNLWPDQFEFFDGQTTRLQPQTAEEYRRVWKT